MLGSGLIRAGGANQTLLRSTSRDHRSDLDPGAVKVSDVSLPVPGWGPAHTDPTKGGVYRAQQWDKPEFRDVCVNGECTAYAGSLGEAGPPPHPRDRADRTGTGGVPVAGPPAEPARAPHGT